MRIIGEIPHPVYKITILHMNNKHSLKIEDGLYDQVYSFRDGEPLNNVRKLTEYVSESFLEEISQIFKQMKTARNRLAFKVDQPNPNDEFDTII